MPQQPSFQRARAKTLARRKRRENQERRRVDSIAHGETYVEVEAYAKVSAAAARRKRAEALAERGPGSVETFIALHRVWLQKALRPTARLYGFGEAPELCALLAPSRQIERYRGLQRALRRPAKTRLLCKIRRLRR